MIELTQEEYNSLKSKGLSDDDIDQTISYYESQGISSDDIRKKITAKISGTQDQPVQNTANTTTSNTPNGLDEEDLELLNSLGAKTPTQKPTAVNGIIDDSPHSQTAKLNGSVSYDFQKSPLAKFGKGVFQGAIGTAKDYGKFVYDHSPLTPIGKFLLGIEDQPKKLPSLEEYNQEIANNRKNLINSFKYENLANTLGQMTGGSLVLGGFAKPLLPKLKAPITEIPEAPVNPSIVTANPVVTNEIVPYTGATNTSLIPKTPGTQGTMGTGSNLFNQPARPQQPISGLLTDNMNNYRNLGLGREGAYADLSPNTGWEYAKIKGLPNSNIDFLKSASPELTAGIDPNFLNTSYEIIGEQIGKTPGTVKSLLNSTSQKGAQLRREFVQKAINNSEDGIQQFNPSWQEHYPFRDLNDLNARQQLANEAFDSIVNNKKPVSLDNIDAGYNAHLQNQYNSVVNDALRGFHHSKNLDAADTFLRNNLSPDLLNQGYTDFFKALQNYNGL